MAKRKSKASAAVVTPDYLRDWAARVREAAVGGKLSADDAIALAVDWVEDPICALNDVADDADKLAATLADLPTADVEAYGRAFARALTPDQRAAFMAELTRG